MKPLTLSLALAIALFAGSSAAFAGDEDQGKDHDKAPGKERRKAREERKHLDPCEAAWARILKKFDRDRDGEITKEEIDQVRAEDRAKAEERRKAREGQPKAPGGKKHEKRRPGGGEHGKRPHRPHPNLVKDFDKIDSSKDGKVSKEEFEKACEAACEPGERKGEGKRPEEPKGPSEPKREAKKD